MANKLMMLSLCTLGFLFVNESSAQALSKDRETENMFAPILRESMNTSHLVADVEVVRFRPEKRKDRSTLYRIESKVFESFKGPQLKMLVFYQWTDEDLNIEDVRDDVTGGRIIVTLRKNPQDGRYYVPDHGSSFPLSKDLLEVAREIAKKIFRTSP